MLQLPLTLQVKHGGSLGAADEFAPCPGLISQCGQLMGVECSVLLR